MKHLSHSILLLICLTILFASFATAQNMENQSYFLRHNLIFFSDKIPKVSPINIVFTDESICGFYPKVYESPILNRNTEVKIISVDKENKKAKVTFETKNKQYEILLENSSEKEFKKSFKLAFSKKIFKVKNKDVKSWEKAIKQFGFPIAKCKSDSSGKGWFYILEFSPNACGSYDGCIIEVVKEGISISGYN